MLPLCSQIFNEQEIEARSYAALKVGSGSLSVRHIGMLTDTHRQVKAIFKADGT